MNSDYSLPVNIGNPSEFSINELANLIKKKINPDLDVIHKVLPEDDPLRRKPIIELAKSKLDWEPKISLEYGLEKTISYFKGILWINW